MKKFIKEILPYIIIIIAVVLFRTFIATPVRVSGHSMDDTLSSGEIMILNKLSKIDRFDIVVIDSLSEDDYLIKRVIGLPNETVEYTNGKLYINDYLVKDEYGSSETEDFEKIKLGSDEYFVMGDNRILSKDSRLIGPINSSEIKGTTNFVIFPFTKIGKVK